MSIVLSLPSARSRALLPIIVGCVVLGLGAGLPSARAGAKRELPEHYKRSPYSLMSLSIGYPNDGWQLRAKRLRPSPHLKIRKDCRKNSYGHPALVLMLSRTARDIASASPGSVLLVGDMSRASGGPLSGHRSHQSGRDADIGFFVTDLEGRPKLSNRFYSFKSDGTSRDGSPVLFDDWRNWLLVKSWIKDRRAGISHIFVHDDLRRRILRYAAAHPRARKYLTEAAALLKQPENSGDHADHFHVRIDCPKRQSEICRNESK